MVSIGSLTILDCTISAIFLFLQKFYFVIGKLFGYNFNKSDKNIIAFIMITGIPKIPENLE